MMAMAILKRNGVGLRHGLRLVSGADEEHGGRWGFGWLADNHPESLESDFAVNEGGGTPVEQGGALSYLLGTGEKGRLEIKITLRGESAHASVPWQGVNASARLWRVLQRIEAYEPEIDTSLPIFEHLNVFGVEEKPTPGKHRQDHRGDLGEFAAFGFDVASVIADGLDADDGQRGNQVEQCA